MKDRQQPAFPQSSIENVNGSPTYITEPGLTKREWFAGMALSGLLASKDDGAFVKMAYIFADAMIAEGENGS